MRHGLIRIFEYLVAKVDLVDREGVLPGEVLLDSRQERLREEEATDPEAVRLTVRYPIFVHGEALFQIFDVAEESLATWVRLLEPLLRDRVVLNAC